MTTPAAPAPVLLVLPMETVAAVSPADPALACGPGAAAQPQPGMANSTGYATVRQAYVPLMVLPEPHAAGSPASAPPAENPVPASPVPSGGNTPAAPAAPAGGNDGPRPWGGGTGLPAPSALPPVPGSGSGSGAASSGTSGALAWLPGSLFFIPPMGADPISGPLQHVHPADAADPGSSPD
ncbi:hypothetical protein FFF93_004165 [Arthrobacter sp. KBS0702]|uniref:hypothetical protein n=1 Tax=Arthrobacter sp. KBS0702 TaxID=2578107 RepID=UPI00119FDBC8|nr:hypothetical protein [Arthrobacter sp. KBS0702]QDW29055.1 hypothetical protein FFF93_004165 [Arthrobacter sp. KBS0702]